MAGTHARRGFVYKSLLWSAAALGATGLLFALRALTGDAFFTVYTPVCRALLFVLSYATAIFPFSVAELVIVLGATGLAAALFFLLYRAAFSRSEACVRTLGHFFCLLLALASVLVFIFYAVWGLGYGAPELASTLGLSQGPHSPAELEETARGLAAELNAAVLLTDRAQDGSLAELSFGEASNCACAAVSAAVGYPMAPVKRVLLSVPLSYTMTAGIFIPHTGEANVNANNVAAVLPFVMAHELSHRWCINPEDEANFFAFLCLYEHGDAPGRYSALLSAWQYTASALSEADYDAYAEIYRTLDARVLADLRAYNAHWNVYKGKVGDLSQSVNDAYLQVQGESDGVKSYGRMVDLLISYRLKKYAN